jgi:hypothetical protein
MEITWENRITWEETLQWFLEKKNLKSKVRDRQILKIPHFIDQWSSTWGIHTAGGTRRYLRGI